MKLFFVLYETPGPKKHRNFELLKIGQLERMLERFEVIAKGHQVHFWPISKLSKHSFVGVRMKLLQ